MCCKFLALMSPCYFGRVMLLLILRSILGLDRIVVDTTFRFGKILPWLTPSDLSRDIDRTLSCRLTCSGFQSSHPGVLL